MKRKINGMIRLPENRANEEDQIRSSSLKGLPHSGQNLGGLVASAGCQPQVEHL